MTLFCEYYWVFNNLYSSTVNFILLHLCFGEWSQKSSPFFVPFKKEISCWAFLSYSCQNWGCGLFNLCTWSLLISWKICKMLFLSNLWGNNLKKSNFFWTFAKGVETFASALKKKLGKKRVKMMMDWMSEVAWECHKEFQSEY